MTHHRVICTFRDLISVNNPSPFKVQEPSSNDSDLTPKSNTIEKKFFLTAPSSSKSPKKLLKNSLKDKVNSKTHHITTLDSRHDKKRCFVL